ncbi:MAG TPA: hypothetical protein PLK67_08280 [Bryobacteraceae bacterium]|nr:hypothetical protein [Bryobacteraceae bacterium]
MNGWIAVDLDGTLAEYHGWPADGSIGAPIPEMVEQVKQWLAEGKDVRIFTARVWPNGTAIQGAGFEREKQATEQAFRIQEWCRRHIGRPLPVTCVKDPFMVEQYDDRAFHVVPNTGRILRPE